ncbi:TPR-like protein, partial [Gymnopus androsaceus JB14]
VLQCPSPSQYFVGREDILRKLSKIFSAPAHVVTLVASGGTGKTQTVLKFENGLSEWQVILKHLNRFSNVWFFDASSNDTLTANFKELGKAAGVGEDVKSVRDFLGRFNQNWLCIFDNADNEHVFLKEYIPICSHGNVIITSRLSESSQMASPDCQFDLMDLTIESAVELLLNQAHKQCSDENQDLAFKIVEALSYHALAVSTAGAYIGATPTCTLENYFTHFNKKKKKILNYKMRSLDSYQRTVYSAFYLSFEKLTYRTQFLMQICAYLHPTAIPLEIFSQAAAFTGNDTSTADVDPPIKAISFLMEFLSLFGDEDSWEDSAVEMCQLSLASYDAVQKCLKFHAVIHTCAQETVEFQEYISQTAILLLARAIPRGDANEEYQLRRKLLIHASHQALGDHHPLTLKSMNSLALTYQAHGKLEAAVKLGEEVVLLDKKLNGEHHLDTLTAMADLALIYWKHEKLEAAEKLGEEVLLLRKKMIGDLHPHTLNSMANLAITYCRIGKLEAAEKLEEEVLPLRKQVLGEHHPLTLISMANLAFTYREHGKLEAAERLEEEVLLLCKKVNGEHHPDTLTAMANLALTYWKHGKSEAAEKLE